MASKHLNNNWAVVVAQLVERSILTPEIRGSNPDIGKILSTNCPTEKTKIKKKEKRKKKKEGGNGPSLKTPFKQ